MKPYYQDDFVTLYHGDAREQIGEVGHFDLLLSDPPYGLPGEDVNGALKILKRAESASMALFTDWRNSHRFGALPRKVGELAWEYGWVSGGRSKARCGVMPTHNTIHLFGAVENFHFTDGTLVHRQPGFSSPRQCSFAAKSGHPFEKPVALLKWLISRIECADVLDPFAGSGSTLVAAKSMGRPCCGIEIEERWCEVAAKRLSQEVLNLGGVA